MSTSQDLERGPSSVATPPLETGILSSSKETCTETTTETTPPPPQTTADGPHAEKGDNGGDDDIPDGGRQAWIQIFACHLVNAMSWGYAGTFGVYQLYYTQEMKLPSSQISWIGSIQIFLSFFVCTVSGRLADAGYSRQTVVVGSALAVFGTFMTSLATQYWQILLAQGVCTGLGLGIMFMPAVSIASSYFKKRRAFALAIAATGTGTGSVVFPATVQYLIPKVGFPWAVRCQAFIAMGFSVVAVFLLKPRLAPRRSGPLIEWGALREPSYVLFAWGAFLHFWVLYFGFFYINTYARNIIGFETTKSVDLLLITNGVGIIGRPITGYLADRYLGPINVFILGLAVLTSMIFSWMAVTTRTGMYVFCVFFGFTCGATQGIFVGSLTSLTKDPRKTGTRFGMVATLTAFATLAGPPTAGAIIDRSGGEYRWAQVWGGLGMFCSMLTIMAARFWTSGARWKYKI